MAHNLNNSVQLHGRIARDIEVRYSQRDGGEQLANVRFSVAVNRPSRRGEESTADFISCISFGSTAEFIGKYFKKGQEILLSGSIQTGSYTNKDGQKVYTTDVLVDGVAFCGSKDGNASASAPATPPAGATDGPAGADFMSVDGLDDLPF